MQDKESDGSTKLKDAIDRALVRFVTDRLTEEIRDDVLTAIKEAGMVIVPREPTAAMLFAAMTETAIDLATEYRAMITAGEE